MTPPEIRLHHKDPFHIALALCRYWQLTYDELPKWRFLARHRALVAVERWGRVSILLRMEGEYASDSPGEPGHPV